MRHETVTLKATVLKINNLEIEETKNRSERYFF